MTTKIGNHVVRHGSIMDHGLDEMLTGRMVRVLYSDPPWSNGNMKYWATMSEKANGAKVIQPTFQEMVSRFVDLIHRYVTGWVFLEMGCLQADSVMEAIRPVLDYVEKRHLQYRSGSKRLPNRLIIGRRPGVQAVTIPELGGMTGASVSKAAVASVAEVGGTVLDPCCGKGFSAMAAVSAGMVFVGNELNKSRLDATIHFLNSAS